MAGSIKLIKRRIRSISSTAKLTRAMQMIATASMRKAVDQSHAAMPFAAETVNFLHRFAHAFRQNDSRHPYITPSAHLEKVLAVVITSNRGLCGSYHSNLEKKLRQVVTHPEVLLTYPLDQATEEQKQHPPQVDFEWIVVGRKGERMIKKLHQPIIASFNKLNENVDLKELDAVFNLIREQFDTGRFQKVIVFYTEHINSLKQVPTVGQLLPISEQEVRRVLDEWELNFRDFIRRDTNDVQYVIEPNQDELLAMISMLLIKMLLHYFVLESKAAVESARMIAMKNASDAATEMEGVLTLAYNQLRQGKITNEIAEISAGSAALE
ncbi:ATP synthase F1 subunit gamma [bacterium]|nr:ATP synthase F1 subunit gamma [bacterium]